MRRPQLSLRTLLWIFFAIAIAVGWYWETRQIREKLNSISPPLPWIVKKRSRGPTISSILRQSLLTDLKLLSDEELLARFENQRQQQVNLWPVYREEFERRWFEREGREPGPDDEPEKKLAAPEVEQLLAELRPLDLEHFVDREQQARTRFSDFWQVYLSELIRRRQLDELQRLWNYKADAADYELWSTSQLLTALRRVQEQRDPVSVRVQMAESAEGPPPRPLLHVTVENVDIEKETFEYVVSDAHWRMQLTDEWGNVVADSNVPAAMLSERHGHHSMTHMPFGPYHYRVLDAREYVAPPRTGRYTLQLLCSVDEIHDEPDLTSLILWKSEPIQVHVINRTHDFDRRFATWRFVALLLVAAGIAAIETRSARRSKPRYWRALFAFTLITTLTGGWLWDVCRLQTAIDQKRSDTDAEWTMTLE